MYIILKALLTIIMRKTQSPASHPIRQYSANAIFMRERGRGSRREAEGKEVSSRCQLNLSGLSAHEDPQTPTFSLPSPSQLLLSRNFHRDTPPPSSAPARHGRYATATAAFALRHCSR